MTVAVLGVTKLAGAVPVHTALMGEKGKGMVSALGWLASR